MDTSNILPIWAIVTLAISGILLLIYIIAIYKRRQVVVSSFVKNDIKQFVGDQVYFLPAASVQVTATVNIAITRALSDNRFISADICELSFTTVVQIQADKNNLLKLSYKGIWFASDDLRLTTDTTGLLSSIAVTSEDRFSNIITQLSDAPKKILSPDRAAALAPEPVIITNPAPITKVFILYPDDLIKTKLDQDWQINLEGFAGVAAKVDASFQIKLTNDAAAGSQNGVAINEDFSGILTRPLKNLGVSIHVNRTGTNTSDGDMRYEKDAAAHFELMVPDTRRILQVPLRRSPFIKRVQTPKFSSGLLVENYINKPSELEGLFSIPINIAKAVFAIPAQLLSFKIAHVQQENAMETELQKLRTARAAAEKDRLNSQKDQIANASDLLTFQKNLEAAKKDLQDLLVKVQAEKPKPG